MLAGNVQIAGSEAADNAARDWQAMRAASDIQYGPLPPAPTTAPPDPPAWLEQFHRFLKALFEPLGQAIGVSWPVMQYVLIVLAAAGVLFIAWRLLGPLLDVVRRPRAAKAETEWAPDRAEAEALLDDADRLAQAGRFDEAAHLLLRRSVQHISAARPDWLHPASTAREIATLTALPSAARGAFGVIAARVERSRYALRPLDGADWQAARAAYADFALQRLDSAVAT